MPFSETLTDDYVAQLLAKDAKDRSIKYSSYGLQAILPKRPTTNAPKPNTRFLKNIIKETDNHNAALRAKEIADARLRLRGINGNGSQNDTTKKKGPTEDIEGITKITALSPRPSAPAIVDTIGDGTAGVRLQIVIEVEAAAEDQDIKVKIKVNTTKKRQASSSPPPLSPQKTPLLPFPFGFTTQTITQSPYEPQTILPISISSPAIYTRSPPF
ncbi:MAG: hypothetical protein Q9213_008421 [Squamulea squamosa]